MYNRILVAIDASPDSPDDSLNRITQFAKMTGGSVHLLHVARGHIIPTDISAGARFGVRSAEDDVDHARELVVGAFELLSTRAAQKTNETMRVLTFVTVLLGTLALVAGIMGMNFELAFFKTGQKGFLIVTGAMVAATVGSILVALWRKWI